VDDDVVNLFLCFQVEVSEWNSLDTFRGDSKEQVAAVLKEDASFAISDDELRSSPDDVLTEELEAVRVVEDGHHPPNDPGVATNLDHPHRLRPRSRSGPRMTLMMMRKIDPTNILTNMSPKPLAIRSGLLGR
jgi:hypothetical protein